MPPPSASCSSSRRSRSAARPLGTLMAATRHPPTTGAPGWRFGQAPPRADAAPGRLERAARFVSAHSFRRRVRRGRRFGCGVVVATPCRGRRCPPQPVTLAAVLIALARLACLFTAAATARSATAVSQGQGPDGPSAIRGGQAAGPRSRTLQAPARQAVESVKSTATEGGQTVAQEGRSAAQDVQATTPDAAGTVRQNPSSPNSS